MFIQPIDYLLLSWFIVAILCAIYVAWDQFSHNPEPAVMKWAFVLVTLYLGPVGLILYMLADQEPAPGTHEEYTKPLWKQGIGSTMHCIAGDATGILIAATITAIIGLPMWGDVIVEYFAGFVMGLFIFQALFMRKVMGGGYWENVRGSFLPEFISMSAMMSGMIPTMSILMMGRDMRAMWPGEMIFWAVMALGIGVGFAVAYPFNVWLVSKGLKHGLMTVRSPKKGSDEEDNKNSAMHNMPHMNDLPLASRPTRPQVTIMVVVTSIMLFSAYAYPFTKVNMRLSAHEVGDLIMPRGMIMDFNTPADSMKDMAAVNPRTVKLIADKQAQGAQVLEPKIENGVKVFELETKMTKWNILPNVQVDAVSVNGQIPGPTLRVTEGDTVRINVTNKLEDTTSIHWHGMILPNEMDGVAGLTQKPIPVGETFSYEFTTVQNGTYFYHSHDDSDRQQSLGLYGSLIIDPKDSDDTIETDHEYTVQLQEWLHKEWLTYPAMPMEGAFPNYFTINGKSFPSTDTIKMKQGETLRMRFIGSNTMAVHPMHMHGGPFEVVAVDGETLEPDQRYLRDTVNIGPGQHYDVVWTARKPGKWLVHCHIPHHTTNNNTETDGGGGLMMVIDVE